MDKTQIKYGFFWGAFMYIAMVIIWPYIDGNCVSLKKALIGIPIWFGCGFIQAYIIRSKPDNYTDK